jgi:hypothetical protein
VALIGVRDSDGPIFVLTHHPEAEGAPC